MKKNTILLFPILIMVLLITITGCGGGGGGGSKKPKTNSTVTTGNISGIVKDASDDKLLDGVTVTVFKSSDKIGTGTTDTQGKYFVNNIINGNNYHVLFAIDGYQPATYYNINVNGSTSLQTVLLIKKPISSEKGIVSGRIIDGTKQDIDKGVEGVTINFREGFNNITGEIINSTKTDPCGYYSKELPVGYYTAELSKDGWITTYISVICPKGGQNGVMTPIINNDQIRIILTWGEEPQDLDAHLTGPLAPGDSSPYPDTPGRFHTYYDDLRRTYRFNDTVYAELDVDDRTSFGPETTTIHKFCSGTYRFSAHYFADYSEETSMALANSGAQVRVFQGSALIKTFNVPVNQTGIIWTVFELDGDTRVITPINTVTKARDDIPIESLSLDKK